MKKIYSILAIVTTVMCTGLTSCSDVFDDLSTNPNQQGVNGFYTTPDNINKGIIGIYSYISTPRAMGVSGLGIMFNKGDEGSSFSDYTEPGQYSSNITSSYYTIVQPYSLFYTAASQACQMIEVTPNVEFGNVKLKNAYLGEAYFLRAFAHFWLFTNFRNIPMMSALPKSAKDYKPQATPEEMWDFIIADLKKAKELLPEKTYWGANNAGRATKGAAAALLGKAYLYRSGIEPIYGSSKKTYYSEAAAEFNEVIRGDYGKYILNDDYNWNFDVKHENSDESVFEIQFMGDAVNTVFNPGLATSGVWRDPRGFQPPWKGSKFSQVMHNWVYDTFVNSKDANGKTDYRMFGTLVFDDSAPEISPKEGERVKVFDGKTYQEYYGTKGFGQFGVPALNNYKSACRKSLDWTLPTTDPGTKMYMGNLRAFGLNYPYIRYADVLLMYAESVVMGGKQGDISALDAVNMVRSRKSVSLPKLASVDMTSIEKERVLELTGEGHRGYDLLRWGKLSARFKELTSTDPYFKKYSQGTYQGFKENKDEWLPIPQEEVDGNPYITTNNPGW